MRLPDFIWQINVPVSTNPQYSYILYVVMLSDSLAVSTTAFLRWPHLGMLWDFYRRLHNSYDNFIGLHNSYGILVTHVVYNQGHCGFSTYSMGPHCLIFYIGITQK